MNFDREQGIWIVDAPNWTVAQGPALKVGLALDSFKLRTDRGLRWPIGQLYGVLGPGMIMAQHVFRGLKRRMLVRSDQSADRKKLAVTWAAKRDAEFIGDPHSGRLQYHDAPPNSVFAVYVSPNEMLERFPSIYGWAEHWTWIGAAPDLAGAPIDWNARYDERVWSQTS